MGEEQCIRCKNLFISDDNGNPLCYDCNNFSSSKYMDALEDALENGTIDIDSDFIEEFKKRCPKGDCGNIPKESLSINDRVAVFLVSKIAGTMNFFWLCVILATLPLIFPPLMQLLQYISSGYLQLIYLPLILVAGNIASRITERINRINFRAQLKTTIEIQQLNFKIDKVTKSITQIGDFLIKN